MRKRGWVEKFYKLHMAPTKKSPRVKKKRASIAVDQPPDVSVADDQMDDDSDDDDDDLDDDDDIGGRIIGHKIVINKKKSFFHWIYKDKNSSKTSS